jgi:hypothetical protein
VSEVAIGLCEAGRNRTVLSANVGNELVVKWDLTDVQLALLASQAVNIVRRRAEHGAFEAGALRAALEEFA